MFVVVYIYVNNILQLYVWLYPRLLFLMSIIATSKNKIKKAHIISVRFFIYCILN